MVGVQPTICSVLTKVCDVGHGGICSKRCFSSQWEPNQYFLKSLAEVLNLTSRQQENQFTSSSHCYVTGQTIFVSELRKLLRYEVYLKRSAGRMRFSYVKPIHRIHWQKRSTLKSDLGCLDAITATFPPLNRNQLMMMMMMMIGVKWVINNQKLRLSQTSEKRTRKWIVLKICISGWYCGGALI